MEETNYAPEWEQMEEIEEVAEMGLEPTPEPESVPEETRVSRYEYIGPAYVTGVLVGSIKYVPHEMSDEAIARAIAHDDNARRCWRVRKG